MQQYTCTDDRSLRSHLGSSSQSSATPNPYSIFHGFGGCGRLLHALTPPRSAFLYLQFLARCHPYILLQFLMNNVQCQSTLTTVTCCLEIAMIYVYNNRCNCVHDCNSDRSLRSHLGSSPLHVPLYVQSLVGSPISSQL